MSYHEHVGEAATHKDWCATCLQQRRRNRTTNYEDSDLTQSKFVRRTKGCRMDRD